MYTYLNQIIACCRRPGRYFMREIMVSPNSAVVTRVEVIPEGYEQVLWSQQRPNEAVLAADIPLDVSRYQGCPFCGQREVFTCMPSTGGCGSLSCHGSDDREHYCPGCDRVTAIYRGQHVRASRSGFVEGPRALPAGVANNSLALTLRHARPAEDAGMNVARETMERVMSHYAENAPQERKQLMLHPASNGESDDDSPWNIFRKRRQ